MRKLPIYAPAKLPYTWKLQESAAIFVKIALFSVACSKIFPLPIKEQLMSKKGHSNRHFTSVCPLYICVNVREIGKRKRYMTIIAKSADKITLVCAEIAMRKTRGSAAQ